MREADRVYMLIALLLLLWGSKDVSLTNNNTDLYENVHTDIIVSEIYWSNNLWMMFFFAQIKTLKKKKFKVNLSFTMSRHTRFLKISYVYIDTVLSGVGAYSNDKVI